jgi:hypothetical protein
MADRLFPEDAEVVLFGETLHFTDEALALGGVIAFLAVGRE